MAGKGTGSWVAQTCRGLATEADRVCAGITEGVPPGRASEGRAGRSGRNGPARPLARSLLRFRPHGGVIE